MKPAQFRQGDILLVLVKALPADARELGRCSSAVLKQSPLTGHAHRLCGDELLVLAAGEDRFVQSSCAATLIHEEHAPISVPPGTYQVVQQREYWPQGGRHVVD